MRPTNWKYFVVMRDLGRLGLESVVHPERTRRDIIDMIASGEFRNIAFIHSIDGMSVEDVTEELLSEASALAGYQIAAE